MTTRIFVLNVDCHKNQKQIQSRQRNTQAVTRVNEDAHPLSNTAEQYLRPPPTPTYGMIDFQTPVTEEDTFC
jgi:hypothetical protein